MIVCISVSLRIPTFLMTLLSQSSLKGKDLKMSRWYLFSFKIVIIVKTDKKSCFLFFYYVIKEYTTFPSRPRQCHRGLDQWFSSKEFICNAGDSEDMASVPGLGRSPGGVHGNPLQYSCLENPMDRGAQWATVHSVSKCQTQLSD